MLCMLRLPFSKDKQKNRDNPPYHLLSDQKLISACLSGDAAAWDALIGRYAALIFSVCLRMGLSHADAEDIFQDVCLVLLNHLADVRDTAKLSGWLIPTTKRETWRFQKRRNVILESDMGESAWEMEGAESVVPQPGGGNPETEILALEEQQLMREALKRMPDRCRNLLTLLYTTEEPPSYQELAVKFSLPVGSIGPTRARCLQNLRKILQELGF